MKEKEKYSDEFEGISENSAERIGKRIRDIRTARGLTQSELGQKVELSADRIQKYENGVRTPKKELLKKIANALDVSPLALADPTISDPINSMYALFEIKKKYGMKIDVERGKVANITKISLSFDESSELFDYLLCWYTEWLRINSKILCAETGEEVKKIKREYEDWKWNLSRSTVLKSRQEMLFSQWEAVAEVFAKNSGPTE